MFFRDIYSWFSVFTLAFLCYDSCMCLFVYRQESPAHISLWVSWEQTRSHFCPHHSIQNWQMWETPVEGSTDFSWAQKVTPERGYREHNEKRGTLSKPPCWSSVHISPFSPGRLAHMGEDLLPINELPGQGLKGETRCPPPEPFDPERTTEKNAFGGQGKFTVQGQVEFSLWISGQWHALHTEVRLPHIALFSTSPHPLLDVFVSVPGLRIVMRNSRSPGLMPTLLPCTPRHPPTFGPASALCPKLQKSARVS